MTSTVLLRLALRKYPLRFQPCIRSLKVANPLPNSLPNSLLYHQFHHLPPKSTPASVKSPDFNGRKESSKSGSGLVGAVTVQEQRRKDWNIIRKMMEHMWPRDWTVRSRVVLGLGLLVGGKVNRALNLIVFQLNIARTSSR